MQVKLITIILFTTLLSSCNSIYKQDICSELLEQRRSITTWHNRDKDFNTQLNKIDSLIFTYCKKDTL